MTPDMQEALHILERDLHEASWDIRKPNAGNHDAFVASHGEYNVFLKFDVNAAVLNRLAALNITPAVLGSGNANDRSYAIQEYVEGSHPDREWFSQHLPDLARFIKTYHTDEELRGLLLPPEPTSYTDHIQQSVDRLKRGMHRAHTAPLRSTQAIEGFHRLANQAGTLPHTPLVPTHADPNNKNFLLVGNRFYLLDWDESSLSDPLRDTGLLLWWYVPQERWSEFFTAYGTEMNDAIRNKVYWWSAFASLGVAQWLDEHTQNESGVHEFLHDFYAASNRQENPHAQAE